MDSGHARKKGHTLHIDKAITIKKIDDSDLTLRLFYKKNIVNDNEPKVNAIAIQQLILVTRSFHENY